MYYMRLALLLSLTLLWSCDSLELNKKEFKSLVNEPIVRYREAYNVRFGDSEFQTFDIFYPENAYGNPSDVVMLLHGEKGDVYRVNGLKQLLPLYFGQQALLG